LATSPPGLNRF